MTTIATLGVKLVAETNQFRREMRSVPKDLDAASASARNAKQNVQGMGEQSKRSTASIGQFTASIGTAAAALGTVTAAAYTAKKAFDFSKEGAQIQRLEEAGGNFARSMGADFMEMRDAIVEASNDTITRFDAMQSASRAMALGVTTDAGQMADLMEVARFRARLMGMDTTQAFDDIVTGIGRTSPKILDNLGIVFDAQSTYSTYAESVGKAVEQLTEAEKIQALLTQTIATGKDQIEAAGGVTEDAAEGYEQLEVAWADLTDSGKILLADVLGPSVKRTADLTRAIADGDDVLRTYLEAWTDWSGIGREAVRSTYEYRDAVEDLGFTIDFTGQVLDQYGNRVQMLPDEIVAMAKAQEASTLRWQAAADAYLEADAAAGQVKQTLEGVEDIAERAAAAAGGPLSEFEAVVRVSSTGVEETEERLGNIVSTLERMQELQGLQMGGTEPVTENVDPSQFEGVGQKLAGLISEDTFTNFGKLDDAVLDAANAVKNELNPGLEATAEGAGTAAEAAAPMFTDPLADVRSIKQTVADLDGSSATVFIDYVSSGNVPADRRATGGPVGEGWTLTGERGRELISPWGWVYDAQTTRKLLDSGLMPEAERAIAGPIAGGGSSGGGGSSDFDPLNVEQRQQLKSGGGGGGGGSPSTTSTSSPSVADTSPAVTNKISKDVSDAVTAAVPAALAPIISRQLEETRRNQAEQISSNRRILQRLDQLVAATRSLPKATDHRSAVREGMQSVSQER